MYFNYHAKIKKLINNGDLLYYSFFENYNGISPALVLFFKNNKPMPIREHKFKEYLPLLQDKIYINSNEINKK